MSTIFVPGAGVWPTTVFEEYPCTDPSTCQAKPASSSEPLAKTKAWFRTSGTTSGVGLAGAAAAGARVALRLRPAA